MCVRRECAEVVHDVQGLKSTYHKIDGGGGPPPNFKSLNRYNSTAASSNSLKFGTKFDHITADTLQSFRVKGSKIKVNRLTTGATPGGSSCNTSQLPLFLVKFLILKYQNVSRTQCGTSSTSCSGLTSLERQMDRRAEWRAYYCLLQGRLPINSHTSCCVTSELISTGYR